MTHALLVKRIETIIDLSYNIFINKVAFEDIAIHNEASMQMHLGTIIKQIGVLHEFSPKERFIIELETPETIEATTKSIKGGARCDIKIALQNGNKKAEAFIELKYFKKSKNEAVTDNKYALYCDLENLEKYRDNDTKRVCYEILYTDNINYTKDKICKYSIGEGHLVTGSYEYTKDRKVLLKNRYNMHWDIYTYGIGKEKHDCFLKIKL